MYPHVSLTLIGGFLGGGCTPLGEKAPVGRGQFSGLGTAVRDLYNIRQPTAAWETFCGGWSVLACSAPFLGQLLGICRPKVSSGWLQYSQGVLWSVQKF